MTDGCQRNTTRIDELLAAIEQGDDAAKAELVELIYPELKRLAHFQLASERPDHTLNTTAIVHEAYLRLVKSDARWKDRRHFLRAVATVMRHLLVDHARQRNAGKRGDGISPVQLEEQRLSVDDDLLAVLALNDAMKNIAEIDSRLVSIIECRYFAGLTVAETAEALGASIRTVERDWQRARAYLMQAMAPGEH
jgi:RNA polymerase sigma factor (TIGR02999 family)